MIPINTGILRPDLKKNTFKSKNGFKSAAGWASTLQGHCRIYGRPSGSQEISVPSRLADLGRVDMQTGISAETWRLIFARPTLIITQEILQSVDLLQRILNKCLTKYS